MLHKIKENDSMKSTEFSIFWSVQCLCVHFTCLPKGVPLNKTTSTKIHRWRQLSLSAWQYHYTKQHEQRCTDSFDLRNVRINIHVEQLQVLLILACICAQWYKCPLNAEHHSPPHLFNMRLTLSNRFQWCLASSPKQVFQNQLPTKTWTLLAGWKIRSSGLQQSVLLPSPMLQCLWLVWAHNGNLSSSHPSLFQFDRLYL